MFIRLKGVRLEISETTTIESDRVQTSSDFAGNDMAQVYRWSCSPPKGVPKSVDTTKTFSMRNLLVFSESPMFGPQSDHDAYASDLMKRKLVAATATQYAQLQAAINSVVKRVPFKVPMGTYDQLKPFVGFDILANVYYDVVRLRNNTLGIVAYLAIPSAVE